MGKLSKTDFIVKISKINQVQSTQGVLYTDIKIIGNVIYGVRQSTKKEFKINLENLYRAYQNIEPCKLTTTALKPYVDRVQSPSLAILKVIWFNEGTVC